MRARYLRGGQPSFAPRRLAYATAARSSFLRLTKQIHQRTGGLKKNAHRLFVTPLFEEAMACFEEAEKIRPPDNDDPILRWNRCVRLLLGLPSTEVEKEPVGLEIVDGAPVS